MSTMRVKYYQSPDGGLTMQEDYSHMSFDEAYEYALGAHWDVDQCDPVSQGPKCLDNWSDLYWYRWELVSISTEIREPY